MEHIRQFDWCYSQPDIYFLKEDDMAHSVTEKILRNKFRNPAISSDSDEEGVSINWDEIFTKKQNFEKFHRQFVPCLPQCPPPYPKLSSIDGRQQYQCLKVLCADNPHILPQEFMPRPSNGDRRLFEVSPIPFKGAFHIFFVGSVVRLRKRHYTLSATALP